MKPAHWPTLEDDRNPQIVQYSVNHEELVSHRIVQRRRNIISPKVGSYCWDSLKNLIGPIVTATLNTNQQVTNS